MSDLEVRVDRDLCVGSGQCLISAADYFGQDIEGYVELLPDAPTADLATNEEVQEAVEKCPSGALSWHRPN
ncbi:ferredoxin [Kitasatospora griseola]|uniref:ferredoxin n=1 Tax=Kitasatospora griseola TaxID=2064 RepID=UPI003423E673